MKFDTNIGEVETKKQGEYIRVYFKGNLMWSENVKHPSKSPGGHEEFRIYAEKHIKYSPDAWWMD